MTFYEKLQNSCKLKNTSPSAVAKKIGLGNSAAYYWKQGSQPKYETIEKISKELNIEISDLIDDDMIEKGFDRIYHEISGVLGISNNAIAAIAALPNTSGEPAGSCSPNDPRTVKDIFNLLFEKENQKEFFNILLLLRSASEIENPNLLGGFYWNSEFCNATANQIELVKKTYIELACKSIERIITNMANNYSNLESGNSNNKIVDGSSRSESSGKGFKS